VTGTVTLTLNMATRTGCPLNPQSAANECCVVCGGRFDYAETRMFVVPPSHWDTTAQHFGPLHERCVMA
jgi:hypothetical protein